MFRQYLSSVKRQYGFDGRDFFKFHFIKNAFVDEKHDALGVIDDVLCILYIEVVEYRYDYGSICDSCHIYHDPRE